MKSHARLLGHSVHQMLIVFPLGLLGAAAFFDVISLAMGSAELATAAYWMLAAGIVGALVAAPFGLVDWLHIPSGTRAKQIGAMHGGGNLVVTALFIASLLVRERGEMASTLAIVLSCAGLLLALVTAWLGGELVSRLGIGVYDDAGPNAPSSLHDGPAKHSKLIKTH